jgi:hypothetical protein
MQSYTLLIYLRVEDDLLQHLQGGEKYNGMDGDPEWDNKQTRFLAQAYVGDELEVEYSVSDKREERTGLYGILSIDIRVKRVSDSKLVIVSRRNLYRIKK